MDPLKRQTSTATPAEPGGLLSDASDVSVAVSPEEYVMPTPKPLTLTEPPENTPAQCDAALGAYLRAWDQLEMQFFPLFSAILGTHQSATLALLRVGIDQPTLRSILDALAPIRLAKKDQSQLMAILQRWKKASTKRNRLVHGHWMLTVEMIEGPSGKRDHTKSTWVRFYDPADLTIYHQIFGKKRDQKVTASHCFHLSDIAQAINDVLKLANDMKAFNAKLSVIPFVTPEPIELEQ